MNNFIARANIEHYLDLLNKSDAAAQDLSVVTKLLIQEEDKLSRDLEQLEFAESKVAACRDRVDGQRRLRNKFLDGSPERVQAERLLTNSIATLQLIGGFCL